MFFFAILPSPTCAVVNCLQVQVQFTIRKQGFSEVTLTLVNALRVVILNHNYGNNPSCLFFLRSSSLNIWTARSNKISSRMDYFFTLLQFCLCYFGHEKLPLHPALPVNLCWRRGCTLAVCLICIQYNFFYDHKC